MTFQISSPKFFVVLLTVLVLMLLGVSTVFATALDSKMPGDAPNYSGQHRFSRFLNSGFESRNIKTDSFEIELFLDKDGSVIPSTGVATVKGSATCSEPANAYIWGELERRLGRVTVRGYFYSSFRCDGKTAWSATVVSQTGPFVGGKAKVSADVYAYTDIEYDYDNSNRTIILKGGPPPRPYYSAMLETPNVPTTFLTFGILSLGLLGGLVLVVGSPETLRRFRDR